MFFLLCALLQIGAVQLEVEIADTAESRNRGLMFRNTLEQNQGMLFIFDKSEILSFWMKNTYIPLTIGFFDENQALIQIEDMDVPKTKNLPLYQSDRPAQYALEVSRDWFKKHKISIGDKFTLSIE